MLRGQEIAVAVNELVELPEPRGGLLVG